MNKEYLRPRDVKGNFGDIQSIIIITRNIVLFAAWPAIL